MRVTSRLERLDRILFAMQGRGEVTLRQIAELQGLQVTPYLAGCVEQLVQDTYLERRQIEGVYPVTYCYSLTLNGENVAREVGRLYGDI